jgi:L-serine dehydratase
MGGTPHQIEYAAEIGLEHHLGLTCDPIAGLVQIPCIERNALAATKAVAAAQYAILSDGSHFIKYDDIISAMLQTGHDINARYRETAQGGLAVIQR